MANHNDWGHKAESIACEYLIRKGYVVRERNWRPASGHLEIDIISQKDNFIVFIEVKARQNTDYDPIDAVDNKKIRKLVRAASSYLMSLKYDFEYRFDIISISGTPDNFSIDHIIDAFLPPLSGI